MRDRQAQKKELMLMNPDRKTRRRVLIRRFGALIPAIPLLKCLSLIATAMCHKAYQRDV